MSRNDTTIAVPPAATALKVGYVPTTTFSAAEIAAVLQEEFVSAVTAEAELIEVDLPDTPIDIAQMPFEIDSLLAIEILLVVEDVVGFELPSSVVKAGGYESVDNAIELLLPKIEKQWKKHNGEVP